MVLIRHNEFFPIFLLCLVALSASPSAAGPLVGGLAYAACQSACAAGAAAGTVGTGGWCVGF